MILFIFVGLTLCFVILVVALGDKICTLTYYNLPLRDIIILCLTYKNLTKVYFHSFLLNFSSTLYYSLEILSKS